MSHDPNAFEPATRAVVIGASGALGGAFCELFRTTLGFHVTPLSRSGPRLELDVTDEDSVQAAAQELAGLGPVEVIVNCVGLLHDSDGVSPEKTFKHLSVSSLGAYFRVNTIGPALLLKHLTPLMPRDRRSVFASLSARVGSLSDNRLGGWYGYRASKAAHKMILRNAAIELARTHPLAVCAALEELFSVIQTLSERDSGGFYAYDGSPIPW